MSFLSDENRQISEKALAAQVIDACVSSFAVDSLETVNVPWVRIGFDLKDARSDATILRVTIDAECDASWPTGLNADAVAAIIVTNDVRLGDDREGDEKP